MSAVLVECLDCQRSVEVGELCPDCNGCTTCCWGHVDLSDFVVDAVMIAAAILVLTTYLLVLTVLIR